MDQGQYIKKLIEDFTLLLFSIVSKSLFSFVYLILVRSEAQIGLRKMQVPYTPTMGNPSFS